MHKETLEKAASLAHKLGNVFLSTADAHGIPHMTIVQPLELDDQGRFQLMGWLCQYTEANLEVNPHVSILIWECKDDAGYQLIGTVEKMQEMAVLNGYVPYVERKFPLPQVETKIVVHIDKALCFERRPHIDVEV